MGRINFKNDNEKADELAKFMDEYFYRRMERNSDFKFYRINDPTEQKAGVDVCMDYHGKRYYIDEKASLYYCNTNLPTFALEINYVLDQTIMEGWFINNDLKTDYYMLMWPNVICEQSKEQGGLWVRKNVKNIRKTDFTVVEAMLIRKHRLQDSLSHDGWGRERLSAYAEKMRKMDYKYDSKIINEDMKIRFSGQLQEKPVNVVVNKRRLAKVATAVYLVSPDGYAKIRGVMGDINFGR
ncbi:MAG: hypothetical protein LUC41_04685 [Clostridiales bacterium]|nr:hypothetical protein [Clostridiales bacterium]